MKQKTFLISTALSALLISGTACTKSETSKTSAVTTSGAGSGTAPAAAVAKKDNVALVRFVNATPSSKDLQFGDSTPFTNVHSRDVTPYASLPAERHDFKLIEGSNSPQPMASNSEGLSAGKHYTVVAVTGTDGKFSLNPISDDLTPPSPGKAKVRLINLDPAVKDVDLYAGGRKDAVIGGAGLDQPTAYKEIVPSEGTLDIRNSMSKKNAQAVKDMQLEPGKLYTILVFGDSSGKLKVKTVEDVFNDSPNGSKS